MARPAPEVTPDAAAYWQAAAAGELKLQRCSECRLWIHFPEIRCPGCGGLQLEFELVSGRGTIEAFTVIHRSFVPGFDPPYIVAWISLPEQAGLRVMANVMTSDITSVAIGAPVELCFEERDNFGPVPQFKLIEEGG